MPNLDLLQLQQQAEKLIRPANFHAGTVVGANLYIPDNIIIFPINERVMPIAKLQKWLHRRQMLIIALHGELRVVLDDQREHVVNAGDALWVYPCQMHYFSHCSKDYNLMVITFEDGGEPWPTRPNQTVVLTQEQLQLLNTILVAYAHRATQSSVLVLQLSLFLYSITQVDNISRIELKEPPVKMTLYGQVARYIHTHLDAQLTVAELAKHFGCSDGHLRRIFRQAKIGSLGAFIRNARFRMAESLLVSTSFSIKQIVAQCGFNSASTFTQEFGKIHGISPRQFRKDLLLGTRARNID